MNFAVKLKTKKKKVFWVNKSIIFRKLIQIEGVILDMQCIQLKNMP